MSSPRQRALRLAVDILGSESAACQKFGVPLAELLYWISGEGIPPVTLLMQALNVILDDPALAARHAVTLGAREKSIASAKRLRQ